MLRILFTLAVIASLLYRCTQKSYLASDQAQSVTSLPNSVIATPEDYIYPDDSIFRVLSWNVEHFVDPYDNPYIDNKRENVPPQNMPQRVHLLVEALRKADADIVVLQEFEGANYLKKLAYDSLNDMNYRFFADIPSHGWYMNVVLMSRFPLGLITGYGAATTPLPDYTTEDGGYETQNNINTRMWSIDVFPQEDYAFSLTGVHLKAGGGARNIAMRKGQINLLVAQFNRWLAEDPARNMLVAGDFNAFLGSEEIALFTDNASLKNPFLDLIDPAVFSHPSDAPTRRLDYMLVNQNMAHEVVPGTVEVKYFFPPDSMRMISDHLPTVGQFYCREK
ncbi:MAG: endonuclease/exonuclease/phosphatase family protein [Bacteroidota bacterium]